MVMKRPRSSWIAVALLALMAGIGFIGYQAGQPSMPTAVEFELDLPDLGVWEQERTDGGYYTIVDEDGNILDKTVRHVHPEDEFIASNNRHYRVEKVEGDKAYAKLITQNALAGIDLLLAQQATAPGRNTNNKVALYHTHTDESYVPTDGSESIPGKGGIYKVGERLVQKLEEKGVEVLYDQTPHEPHDADAYRRSRRTAVELMKKAPAALIDVHRDGVPDPDFYYTKVAGMDVTKVRLVVGRQNQNMQANLDFAKQIKAQLDKYYPGLIHGIFLAKGNYNQDLSPRSLLIEVGTHTNERELAEKGAMLFADALPSILGISAPETPAAPGNNTTAGDRRSLWWLVTLAVIGIGAFLLLSTGSLSGAMRKLKQFSSDEWANFLGNPRKKEPEE